MDILAVICVQNEAARLRNCLGHLRRNGISYAIIDNGSRDETPEILREPEVKRGLVEHTILPHEGTFDLSPILELKHLIVQRRAPDWFIHHDADEVMHSYVEGETLADAIARQDAMGFTAIDYNEFVFLPLGGAYERGEIEWQTLPWYYFHDPAGRTLTRAGKTGAVATLHNSGGHAIGGAGLRLAHERFALRHYIFLDQEHAYAKYPTRVFDPKGLARGWHNNRHGRQSATFRFPPATALKRLESPASRQLDRSDPKAAHYWDWQPLQQI